MKKIKLYLLTLIALASVNFANAQTEVCDDFSENGLDQLCAEQTGPGGTGVQGPITDDFINTATGAVSADGIDDVSITMESFICGVDPCPAPIGGTPVSDYQIGGCVGANGTIGTGSDFAAIFNPDGADDTCLGAGGYVCMTMTFINGFYSTAAGFDIPFTSQNGVSEGYEGTFAYVTSATDVNGTALAGLPAVNLGNFCNYTAADYGTTQMSDFLGAGNGGVGTLQLDQFNTQENDPTGQNDCAASGENGEDPPSGEAANNGTSTPDAPTGVQNTNPNFGLAATDLIYEVKVIYFYSSTTSTDCNGDGLTAANSDPSGSFQNPEFCFEVQPIIIPCGACAEGSAGLVITELSYDPSGAQGNDGDCEYIELFNSYSNTITLDANTTLELSNGASFTFPAGTTIAPGEYIIIAIDPATIGACAYANGIPAGTQIFGPTGGSLANGGEDLTITLACSEDAAAGNTQTVTFNDGLTPAAGGGGSSVYYPLDGTGPLEGAPTPGSGDCTGCADTEFTCLTMPVCDLTLIPGTAVCDAETTDPDTYTATFTFTDADGMGTYTVTASSGTPDMTTVTNMASGTITVTGITEGTNVTLTMAGGVECDLNVEVLSPVCEPAIVCDISSVVFTQQCTDNGDEYELCVSFDYENIGASAAFNVYLDPAGTGTPTTIVAGPYTYAAYDAAIAGGATCFTIPVGDYAGDATDLEAGIELCVADADAPAPGTGLPPGTVTMGGGLPNPECTSIIGIFANACGQNEGQNEFVVLQNGNTAITGNDIIIDTPANDDYDMWEPAATTAANIATAGWICPCCVAIDGASAIPANATVIVTGNMLDQPYDFTGLCAAAGTVYVLGESSTGAGGHFSNGGGRSTVLNVTNAGAACTYPQSYTYLTSDLIAGGDGDYISFSGPDNPTQTAGNNDDPAGTNGTGSNNGCTGPEVVAEAEVECFGCTTLDEMICAAECPEVMAVDGEDTVCDGSLATEIDVWQALVVADATNATAIADPNTDITVIYSLDAAVSEATPPTAGEATGIYSGADNCAAEDQLTYAYLLCYGDDGVAGGGDDTYSLLGTHTLTVAPAPQEPTIMVTQGDPECTYVLVGVCGDETVDAMIPNEACGTTAPADIMTTVMTAAGCTADFTIAKPACDACGAVCEITDLTATPSSCNPADDTYSVDIDFTVTVPGASNMYTVDVCGVTYGPFDYANLPETIAGLPSDGMNCDVVVTDADNAGGGGTGATIVPTAGDDVFVSFVPDGAGAGGGVDECDGESVTIHNFATDVSGACVTIDISNFTIVDNNGTIYTFPVGTTIAPGGTLTLTSTDMVGPCSGTPGAGDGSGSVFANGGDMADLVDAGNVLINSTGNIDGDAGTEYESPELTAAGGAGSAACGTTACSAMISYTAPLSCLAIGCPTVSAVNDSDNVCYLETMPANGNLATWQAGVETDAANVAAIADINTSIAVEYSTVAVPADAATPDGMVVDGFHEADFCVSETQTTYAYLLCFGDDGVVGGGDDSYLLVGTHALTVYPLPQSPATAIDSDACTTTVTIVSCVGSDMLGVASNPMGGAVIANWNQTTGVYTSSPGEASGSLDVEFISGIVGSTCSPRIASIETPGCPAADVPMIMIAKDDADNTDDTQEATAAGDATFTITITNNGSEDLCNVVLTDAANDGALDVTMCQPTFASIDTDNGAVTAGMGDGQLNEGDVETYTCTVTGATMDYTNTITVNAEGCESGTGVDDDDPTDVTVPMQMVCDIEIIVIDEACEDNDTPDNPNDDTTTYTYIVIDNGGGGTTWTDGTITTGIYSTDAMTPDGTIGTIVLSTINSFTINVNDETDNCIDDYTDMHEGCITPQIPTLSQWGLISLALLLMIFGAVTLSSRTLTTEKRKI